MKARNALMAKMRSAASTRDGATKPFDRGAISVHWPRSEGSLQESWRISAVALNPPATRTRCLSPPACSRSIPDRSRRPSCISFNFRHHHATLLSPLDVRVSSSALLGVSTELLQRNESTPPTTRTASGPLCRHNADAYHLLVGMLGRSTHLQEKTLTCWIHSLTRYSCFKTNRSVFSDARCKRSG